ncbi:Uncharacterized conserved protein YbbC, DUF1343 family [Pustulibacterium marinum]|uniref:Uncharacterized conserved protein YbbC, DUF1343 family n=1 Tax=Pustulibacterium marinum TaxID=1224947 RepID=A0A1I7F8F9_9FLAO|nr:DUF1343 domain-containing protein [Pustulibacterium marinum]SFU32467.1 Uncharacterized conserved protein YbbC, DUF1343 family [Pustulibacterium marinum]
MTSLFKFKNTFLLALILLFSCGNNQAKNETPTKQLIEKPVQPIVTGAENYEAYLPLLEGKNVAIVTNQTGILRANAERKEIHLVDFLLEKGIKIEKILAPEHGFRGKADAGEHVTDGKDSKTGLPIISLYGNNKKPKPEQLKGIDLLVFDLQDVGARFYTYISTLHYVMEACAENKIPVMILDRPNPNGNIIDGPIREEAQKSFVGMHPIPVLHGMTIGEYGKMINGEHWLANGIQCDITVIPCLNYTHEKFYSLPVKPSPNLPNDKSINLYPSLCFFEGTNISVGRGTQMQFQIYGSPLLPKSDFSFTPKPNEGAKNPKFNGEICWGENLQQSPVLHQLELKWLLKAYKEYPQKERFFSSFFTKLAGTKKLQEQIENGLTEAEIRDSWQPGLNQFKTIRRKYLLYQ